MAIQFSQNHVLAAFIWYVLSVMTPPSNCILSEILTLTLTYPNTYTLALTDIHPQFFPQYENPRAVVHVLSEYIVEKKLLGHYINYIMTYPTPST